MPDQEREAPRCVFCQKEIDSRAGKLVHVETGVESCKPQESEYPKAYPSLVQMFGGSRDVPSL